MRGSLDNHCQVSGCSMRAYFVVSAQGSVIRLFISANKRFMTRNKSQISEDSHWTRK